MRVNSDGTYDIEYDDGDVERRVRKSLVRKLEVHQRNRHQSTMTLKMIMSFRVVIASKRGIEESQSGTRAKLCA